MDKIVLIGASDHCRYTIDILEQQNEYQIIGIIDQKLKKGDKFENYPILGYLEELKELYENNEIQGGIIAIGDNFTRKQISEKIKRLVPYFNFVNAVHPSVILGKDVELGVGCVCMAGVIINNNSKIGDHCFLATKASLDHDSTLGDYSSLSPGVTTGGRVLIGTNTAIGIGATILHYKNIGDNCVIGGGSLVNKDLENDVLAFGVPAKPVKKRAPNEKYL